MLKQLSTLTAGLLVSLAAWAVPTVEMTTSLGKITIELNAEKAPKTAAMFLYNAKHGFYDGTIFHRVIDDFMIQGGGFSRAMEEKKVLTPFLKNEATSDLPNNRGSIAMARTSDPHSARVQFFINLKDNDALNHPNRTRSQRLRLCRVRQGHLGHGRRRQDRQGANRQRRLLPECADHAGRHPERQNHLRKIRTQA